MTDQPGSQDIPDEDDIVGDSSATAVAESTAHVADGAALTGPDGEPVDADTGDGDTGPVTGEHALAAPADAAEHAPNPESGEPTDPAGEARHATGADARSSGGNRQRDAAVATPEPPDLETDAQLDAALEALLLVVDVPAGEQLLADTLGEPMRRVRQALHRLSEQYTAASRGIDLRRVGDGWRMYTRETYAPYVERYLLDGQRSKLTRAAMETLAVIAYRQPVTRSRVAAVRGVNVDGVIRTLVGRGLVEEAGTDSETGGLLYCTTELFLERLGLSSLKDLPPLAPLLPEVDAIDDV